MDPDLRRKLLLSTGGGGGGGAAPTASAPSSPLCPLPEHDEISIPIPGSSPPPSSSLKDLLIFGPFPPDPTEALTPPCSPAACADPPPYDDPPWNSKSNLHRSRTAPALSAINEVLASCPNPNRPPSRPSVVRQAFLLLTLYLLLGVAVYNLLPSHFFSAAATQPVVDALYFCIVTMCTIGYGDITPTSPASKLFSIAFVLLGFGFVDILLSAMVSYVLDLQESLLLTTARNSRAQSKHRASYIVDLKKGRMRIRLKVGLALGVVVLCIGVGVAFLRFVESLDWLDSFYLSVMSVTTVGYGDQAFKTLAGRLFASVWLLVSTLAVARAFLYLAEARVDKRHRELAKWVLSRDMTVAEFLAADIDNNGFVSKSEFVIYKLKEMGKIAEKDICQICDQFDRLDTGNCGKITLSDLLESHQQ